MNKEKKLYELDNGTITVFRSHFIRQEFKKGKSRNEIVKMLNDMGDKVSYGIIASATANMDNGTFSNRGRVFLEFENGKKISRIEYIRDQIMNKKRTVREVADELDVHYDIVYAGVNDLPGFVKKHISRVKIQLKDGTLVYRTDYIRQRWAEGATRREIADEADCDYMIVQTTLFRNKKKIQLEGANNGK